MSSSHRRALRSAAQSSSSPTVSTVPVLASPIQYEYLPPTADLPPSPIQLLPPGSVLPHTTPASLRLLRRKQSRLSSAAATTFDLAKLTGGPSTQNALLSTLIFAQYEAGTAVCIDPVGWVLTCSHCIGETEEERQAERRKWLLFYTGLAVLVECRVWDPKRDLALCKIVAVEATSPASAGLEHEAGGEKGKPVPHFGFVRPSERLPRTGDPIFCIGQPGRDDLESATTKRTTYNLVEISEGHVRGMVKGADPQDNSEIGGLKHNAWTYWGHSGAPLVRKEGDGGLVGLHSSWDDQTAMRHGIPLVAIRQFLDIHLPGAAQGSGQIGSGMAAAGTSVVVGRARPSRTNGTEEEGDESLECERQSIQSQVHTSSNSTQGLTAASAILIEDDSSILQNED